MAEETQVRTYGMADQANRDPPPAEGTRGAKSTTEPQSRDPDLSHQVTLGDGSTVTVSEGSGVAYAEATGCAGLVEPKPVDEESPTTATSPWAIALGLLAAVVAIAVTSWRMRSGEQDGA